MDRTTTAATTADAEEAVHVEVAAAASRRLSGGAGHTENFAPQVIQRLAKEVRDLSHAPPDGIAFVPNDDETLMEVHADIEGPDGTPYEGGVFRLKLCVASQFPYAPPRAFFLTRVYHPNVGQSGDVCVNTLKKDWQPHYTLTHTLAVVRCLLIVPFPESALNDEAARLFVASYEQYARRARLFTEVHARRRGGARSVGAGAGGALQVKDGKKGRGGCRGEEGEEGAGAPCGGKLGRSQDKERVGEEASAGGSSSAGGDGKAPPSPLTASSASSAVVKGRNKDAAASSRRNRLKRL